MPMLRKSYKKSANADPSPVPVPNKEERRSKSRPSTSSSSGNASHETSYQPVASRRPKETTKPATFENSDDEICLLADHESEPTAETIVSSSDLSQSMLSSAPSSRPIGSEDMDADDEQGRSDKNGGQGGRDGDKSRRNAANPSSSASTGKRSSANKSTTTPLVPTIEDSSSEDEFIVGKQLPLPPAVIAPGRPQQVQPRNESANARAPDRRSKENGFRSSLQRSGGTNSESSSTTRSESRLSDRSTIYDPSDPDWLKFSTSVQNSPATAHIALSEDLLKSSNSSALLGKLIYRSISDADNLSESRKQREKCGFAIIRAVLHLTIDKDNNSGPMVDLSNMLFTELRHFSTSVLYNIVEHCLNYMKNDKDRDGSLPSRWIEIFGKIICVMITRGDIKHETDVMEGEDFREYVITEMCSHRVNWTTETTASLIAILREIPEIKLDELKLIIARLKSSLVKLKASALPPIIHQLILLAGTRIPSELLALCSEYFERVDFNDLESKEVKLKRNVLGTIVFHFMEAAIHCGALVKAVNKVVKASFFDFGKVMNPFMLSVVIGLTTFEHARNQIVDLLRNSIMKSFHSLHLSEMSYWYQNKVGDDKDVVTERFKSILATKSTAELEFMCDGLRELGIGLLNADSYQQKYPNTLERCQNLGSYLIISIVKSCPDQLSSMLKHLMMVSSNSLVHTECLAKCLEMRTRQIIHPSVIGKTCEIIHHLPLMESTSAAMIVKALSTAFNLSYTLLDTLMIHLRKTIWKSVEARRTSAKIMIMLLSNSKVVGDVPGSQYSESQRFHDSQNQHSSSSFNIHGASFDNQPLCLEILTLAKRCFTQQCEIREELYLGFHSVVRKNPGLCELICCHLYTHAAQYLSDDLDTSDNNAVSTIVLGKVVDLPASTTNSGYTQAKIKEELGFLVQCLSFVVHKSYQAFHSIDDGPPAAVKKLEQLLQKWIKAVLKTSQETIEIAAADVVAGAGGGSRPLDTVRYVQVIFAIQVMQVIEALIEYLNLEDKPRNDKIVKKLFIHHSTIELVLKKEKEKSTNTNKKGKGDKNKTKGKKNAKDKDESVDDATVADDASETSENQQPVVKFKKPDAPKRLVYFHVLTLENALDLLRKLQKSDQDKGVVLSVQREEFEKFLLSTVKQKLTNFKRKEPMRERRLPTQKIIESFADIAGCIWNGVLMHNSGDEDGSVDVTADVLESRLALVNEIVTLLCSSYSSICCHLIKVFSDDDSDASYDAVFPKLFNSWKTVHCYIPSGNNTDDENDKPIHQHLFEILHAFAKPLSPDSEGNNNAAEVLNWMWNYMSSSTGKDKKADFLLAEAVVSCWLTFYMKGRDFLEQPGKRHHDVLTLAVGVKQALGIADEVDSQYRQDTVKVKMWIINDDTAPTILCAIMNHVELILDHITAVVAKLKFNSNDDNETQSKVGRIRGGCFTKIEEIVSVCAQLVACQFPAGLCSTTMLKTVPQIFAVMTGFGEYLFELIKAKRPFSLKGFEKPVAKIGSHFKPLVDAMIQHIEFVQRELANEICEKAVANKKYKGVRKVPQAVKNQLLKEKKLIPSFVYTIEKYDQQIIELSKKSDKIKLLVGMKLSTSRDFKINSTILTDALNSRTRAVQEITTIPDEESNAEAVNNATTSGPSSKSRGVPRPRKARKRKTTEEDDQVEQVVIDE